MNWTSRMLAIVLAIVLVGGGIYVAYTTGFDNGAVAAAAPGDNGIVGDGTGTVVVDRHYGWHGGFGFFPFFFLFPLLFFFLIFGAFRARRWGGGPGSGWGGGPGGWVPPKEMMEQRLTEWHKNAHNEGDANGSGR
jgi:hypothetical protein